MSRRHSPEERTRIEALALAGSVRYAAELRSLFRALHREVMHDLKPFLSLYAGRRQDTWGDLHSRVAHFVVQVGAKVGRFFRRMAGTLIRANKEVLGLLGVAPADPSPALLDAAMRESIRLVETEATRYADGIRQVLAEAQGHDVDSLKAALDRRGKASESKAKLIARDQTVKLNARLTREALESAGFDSYVWNTCMDDRVRPTHRENEGVVFSWASPSPITGHPGDDPLCRCWPSPA